MINSSVRKTCLRFPNVQWFLACPGETINYWPPRNLRFSAQDTFEDEWIHKSGKVCLLATRCWNHGHLDTMSAASTCRIYSQSLAWWLNGKCTNQLRTMSCCMSFFQTKRGRLPSDFNIMGMFFHTVWCSFMFFHVLSYTCIYIYTHSFMYTAWLSWIWVFPG